MKIRCPFPRPLLALALALLSALPARAQGRDDVRFAVWGSGNVFSLSPVKDGILLGAGIALSGADLILDNVLEVNRQEYDGTRYCKDDVNALDRAFMHSYSRPRDTAADVLLLAAMASPAVLAATDKTEWLTCGVMYVETLLIANGIKEFAKLAVNRTRPYMYYDAATFPDDDVESGDWANSFPSGHSTMAFAGATFASYAFCSYFPESPWRVPVVAGSYALACSVAALRLSSGNHFMTDVLAGAALGSLSGFLVPWLHTLNVRHNVSVSVLANGVSLTIPL